MPSAGQELTAAMLMPDAWVDWQAEGVSYTGITVGNGTVKAAYAKVGAFVVCRWELTWGSTTSFSGTPQVTLPYAAHGDYSQLHAIGPGSANDASTAGSRASFTAVHNSNAVFFLVDNLGSSATVSATIPWTWATSDYISFTGTYEAA